MNDTPTTPAIGHNSGDPAPFDPAVHLEHDKKTREWSDAASEWLRKGTLDTEAEAEKVKILIEGSAEIKAGIEAAFAGARAPHEAKLTAVREAYSPLVDTFAGVIKKLKPMIADFIAAQKAKKLKEQQEAQAAIDAKAEAAQVELQRAIDNKDTIGEVEARKVLKGLGKEAKVAAKPVKVNVGSGVGSGRAMGVKKQRYAEITNFDLAYHEVSGNEKVQEAIQSALNQMVRAANWDNRRLRGAIVKEREII